jgi:hypothetical protein
MVRAASISLAVLAMLAGTASGGAATQLHVTVSPKLDFTSLDCPSADLCYVTVTAALQSSLSTSPGRADWSLVVTPVNGSFEPCNHVVEQGVFTFPEGSIGAHSERSDCPGWVRPGPRIDTGTAFQITGGTGAFNGAAGGGTEHAGGAIIYDGTISTP